MSKWTWLTFITWDQINFAEVPLLMATASSSTVGRQRAWQEGKEVAARMFTGPPASPFLWTDNLLLPQHLCTTCPTARTPKRRITTTALAPDLQCSHSASHIGCYWLPQTLDKESSGIHYICGLKDRERLLSAGDHLSPLRQHQNSLWIFHSTLQLGTPQHFCGWWHWHSPMDNISWQPGTLSFPECSAFPHLEHQG